jgi:hypothetical protein
VNVARRAVRRDRDPRGLPQRRSVKTALTEVRAAVREALARYEFGPGEAASALAHLGTDCVFCERPATEWAFLVPLRFGGDAVLGNVAPACRECYWAKRDQDFREWMPQGTKLRRLENHVRHFGYTTRGLDDRLGTAGMRAYLEYHAAHRKLRSAIKRLLRDHGE